MSYPCGHHLSKVGPASLTAIVKYDYDMPRRSSKSKDTQQVARKVLDSIAPDAEPKKPAANKARPPRPTKKRDVRDIERADSEGMAQQQGVEPKPKNPAAVALGKLGGAKGGKARAEKLSAARRKAIAKKAASARWTNRDQSETDSGPS